MNPQSARSLLWLSIILLVAGAAIASPAGTAIVMIPAALCALAPIVAGPRWTRIAGVVVLAAAVALAVSAIPAAKKQLDGYRLRAVGGTR